MLSLTGWLRPVQSQIEFLFLSSAQMSPSRKTALTHTDQQTADAAFIEVLTLNQVNLISRAFCITWLQVFGNVVFFYLLVLVYASHLSWLWFEEVCLALAEGKRWCSGSPELRRDDFFNREWCTQVTLVKVSDKNMEVEMSITDALWWKQQQI